MRKKAINLAAAVLCLVFMFPQKVWGADINITYRTTEAAKAGDKVNVEIEVTGSRPISTLGLHLAYDSSKLTYEGESWTDKVNNADTMTLVSDVEDSGRKALKISMISDAGYQGSGAMVTLAFSAKTDYADAPVELSLRDITDKDMQDISASTNISFQNQEENNDKPNNGSGDENNNNGNNDNNNDNGNNNNNNNGNGNNDNSNNSSGNENSNKNDNTNNGSNNNPRNNTGNTNQNSRTYQTGIEIMDFKVLCLGGLFLLLGFSCIIFKRKLSR